MKVRAILNPRAGVAAHRALDAVRARPPTWPDLEVRLTDGPGRRTAAGARGRRRRARSSCSPSGGDGTANEVARGLLGTADRARHRAGGLGQRPRARPAASPCDPARALAALERGAARRMDVGRSTAAVPERGRRRLRRRRGLRTSTRRGAAGGRRGILTYVRMSLRLAESSTSAPAVRLERRRARVEGAPFIVAFCQRPPVRRRAPSSNPGREARRRAARHRRDLRGRAAAWRLWPRRPASSWAASSALAATGASAAASAPCSPRASAVRAPPRRRARSPERARLEVCAPAARAAHARAPGATAEDPEGPFLPA